MNSVFTASAPPTPMLPMMQTWQAYPPNMYTAPAEPMNNGNMGPPAQGAAALDDAMTVEKAFGTMTAAASHVPVTENIPPTDLAAPVTKDTQPDASTIQQAVDSGTVEPGATLLGPETGTASTAE